MNRKQFTMVELLVVIGIIGVLAGLVFPAVSMARAAGRRTQCVSNQGQLIKLLTITMQAYDNYLVTGGTYGTENSPDSTWTRYLYDKGKLQDLKGYRCPSLPTNEKTALNSGSLTNAQLQSALGVVEAKKGEGGKNYSGFDFRGNKRLKSGSTMIAPAQLILGGCSASVDSSSKIVPRANMFSSDKTKGYFYIVHEDQFNMYALDGHVESVTKEKAVDMRFIPDPEDGTGAVAITADSHIKNPED